ncbi:hypothetical protein DL93DRAFT_2081798 [Clavulina sp. PMI_390]|nr:hypothetical protein DL93DRAFT_2081798 [Clavulina sp. PMI_390]
MMNPSTRADLGGAPIPNPWSTSSSLIGAGGLALCEPVIGSEHNLGREAGRKLLAPQFQAWRY